MSEELLVRHCSPTLAGMKTGSMFTCPCNDKDQLFDVMRKWNVLLGDKGLRFIPLRLQKQRALVYVYRPSRLLKDLKNQVATQILEERGYDADYPEECVVQLKKRLQQSKEFPHEVGLFLGYPPEDVCGFIENKACGCKCVGCWKVYGNETEAKKLFAKYEKCTKVYCAQYANGKPIERLSIAG